MFRLFSRLETNSIPWPILFRVLSQKRDKIPLTAAKPGLKTVKRSRITTPSLSSWQERLFGEFTLSKGVEGCFCKIDMYLSIVATVAEDDGVQHGVACWPPLIMVVMLANPLLVSWSDAKETTSLLSTSVILQVYLLTRAENEWIRYSTAGTFFVVVNVVDNDLWDSFWPFGRSVVSFFVVNTEETTGFPRQQWRTPGLNQMLE